MSTLICNAEGVCGDNNASPRVISSKKAGYVAELVYGFDPLCGWCFGFSRQLNVIRKILGSQLKITLINGGIFAGEMRVPMSWISGHILHTMPLVTERTGTLFGEGFKNLLNNRTYSYDSEKASVAISVIKELSPENVFEFAADIQNAFFVDGADLNDDAAYIPLIKFYGIAEDKFFDALHASAFKSKTYQEFLKAKEYNLAYPSCVLLHNGKSETINIGYQSAESIIKKIVYKLNTENKYDIY